VTSPAEFSDPTGLEMAPADDESPVEALAPDGADHALIDGVGPEVPRPGS